MTLIGLPLDGLAGRSITALVVVLASIASAVFVTWNCSSSSSSSNNDIFKSSSPGNVGDLPGRPVPSPAPVAVQKTLSSGSLPFDIYGCFRLETVLHSSALNFPDVLQVESYGQTFIFQVEPLSGDSELRLIVARGSRFIESQSQKGLAIAVLKPNMLMTLCAKVPVSKAHPCLLSLTVMAPEVQGSTPDHPVQFAISGVKASVMSLNKPFRMQLAAGQPAQVAIQLPSAGADIIVDAKCPQPVYLSAISEQDVRFRNLISNLKGGSNRAGVRSDQYHLRVGGGFHILLLRCEADCRLTVDTSSGSEVKWTWTLYGRLLLLALMLICLIAPTVILVMSYQIRRPSETVLAMSSTQAADDQEHTAQLLKDRLRNLSALSAMPVVTFGRSRKADCIDEDDDEEEEESRCSICLEAYTSDDFIRDLSCAHRFHQACCDSWIVEKGHCPLCLQEIGSAVNYHQQPAGASKTRTAARRKSRSFRRPTRRHSVPN